MNESEHNNLDSFFKRRAQKPDISFNENDWLNLKSRLDEELPVKLTFWYWIRQRWYVPALVSIVAALWLFMSTSNPAEFTSTIENTKIDRESNLQSSNDQATTGNANPDNSKSASDNPITKTTPSKEDTRINDDLLKSSVTNQSKPGNLINTPPAITVVENNDIKEINDKGYVVSEDGTERPRLSGFSASHFLYPLFIKSFSGSEPPATLPSMEINPDQKTKFYKFFVVGIGYGPDFSAVGLDNFVSPGSRLKVDLEYAISPAIYLSTGVGLVSNKYEAYGSEYHAPTRYWRNGPVADEAYGECKMIDIPLNIRYNFVREGKHRAFSSIGLSTYFLTKEDYYFEYYGDYPDAPEHWGTDKTSVYPFSIINISAGYEYLLNSHGSFQVEPFLKIPMGGVGWGDVELYTVGMYFSYRYRFRP